MTVSVQNVLTAFDSLTPTEKQQVAAEILRRTREAGELPDETLDALAAEAFSNYDAEETSRDDR